jgi:hypothetical protein
MTTLTDFNAEIRRLQDALEDKANHGGSLASMQRIVRQIRKARAAKLATP